MKCGKCGHQNRAGILLCENCGSDIYDILVGAAQTKKLGQSSPQDLRLAEPPSSRPLMLYIADGSSPLSVERHNNILFGRAVPSQNIMTAKDIDFTSFNARELGVSRRHAKLNAREEPPTLLDLGSYNGTYVNGQRLKEDIPHELESGDEIQLGRLKMRIYFK